jgi:hypothetical protein
MYGCKQAVGFGSPGPLEADVFGVFDGHGGKQAAVYAAKNLFAEVAADLPNHMTSAGEAGEGRPDDPKVLDAVPESVLREWELQDAVVKGLPAALVSGFSSLNEKYIAANKVRPCPLTVFSLTLESDGLGWPATCVDGGAAVFFLRMTVDTEMVALARSPIRRRMCPSPAKARRSQDKPGAADICPSMWIDCQIVHCKHTERPIMSYHIRRCKCVVKVIPAVQKEYVCVAVHLRAEFLWTGGRNDGDFGCGDRLGSAGSQCGGLLCLP